MVLTDQVGTVKDHFTQAIFVALRLHQASNRCEIPAISMRRKNRANIESGLAASSECDKNYIGLPDKNRLCKHSSSFQSLGSLSSVMK